jgi:ABC-type branched-subunit amino acid transport system permease subunit
MIQRIQTIWLLLASTAAFLSLKWSFYTGNILAADQTKKYEELTAVHHPLILVCCIAVAVAALIGIFIYKNRRLQLRISLIALLAALLNIVLYYFEARKFVEGQYAISALVTLAIPVFLLLAALGINKDEKLVKSLDRLR